MIHDKPDHNVEIAKALATRDRLQAEFDQVKNSYDTCRLIDIRFALNAANRRVLELRGNQAADRPVESARNSSIFFGSNQ
jgi:hypothetical protein